MVLFDTSASDGALLCTRRPLWDQMSAVEQVAAGRDPRMFDRYDPEHGGLNPLSQSAITHCGQCVEIKIGYGWRPSCRLPEYSCPKRNWLAYPAHCWSKMSRVLTAKHSL